MRLCVRYQRKKTKILHLNSIWRNIIVEQGYTREIVYRVEKLAFRLDAVADKIFIKTIKAHDILQECVQLAEQFRSEVNVRRETTFRLLTCLDPDVATLRLRSTLTI